MKSTEAKPGKPIVMKLRDDEEIEIMEWLNLQITYSDSIRYLIQKEIAENGLRNLQLYVPQTRTIESIKAQMASVSAQTPVVLNSITPSSIILAPPPSYQSSTDRVSESISQVVHHETRLDTENVQSEREVTSTYSSRSDDRNESASAGTEASLHPQMSETELQKDSVKDDTNTPRPEKRKAKKQFSEDVANSYAN
jgi:hypothetical protein